MFVFAVSSARGEDMSNNTPVFVIEQFTDAGGDLASQYTAIGEISTDSNIHQPYQVNSNIHVCVDREDTPVTHYRVHR